MSSSMVPKLKVSWMVFLLGIVVLTGFGCADGEKSVGNASPVQGATPSPATSVASDATTQNTTAVSPKPLAAGTLNCVIGNRTNGTIESVDCNGSLGTTGTFSCINTAGTRGLTNCTKTTTTTIHCTSPKTAGISCNITTGILQCITNTETGATECPTIPDPMETFQCVNITGAPAGSMSCTSMNSTGTALTCTSDKEKATILSCTSITTATSCTVNNTAGTVSCPRANDNSQTFPCLSKTGSGECTSITVAQRTIYCTDPKGVLKCAEDFKTAKAWTSAASGVHASISLVFVVMAFLAGRD